MEREFVLIQEKRSKTLVLRNNNVTEVNKMRTHAKKPQVKVRDIKPKKNVQGGFPPSPGPIPIPCPNTGMK
jgi:hypothetical protein